MFFRALPLSHEMSGSVFSGDVLCVMRIFGRPLNGPPGRKSAVSVARDSIL